MVAKSSLTQTETPAGFISRLEAFTIDLILIAISGLSATWLFQLFYRFFALNLIWPNLLSGQYAPVISFVIIVFYFNYFWAFLGFTPGKLLLGLKIVRKDGSDLSLARSFVRFFGYWISAIPLFLGFLWITFDDDRQGWHDKIADTHVVDVKKNPFEYPSIIVTDPIREF